MGLSFVSMEKKRSKWVLWNNKASVFKNHKKKGLNLVAVSEPYWSRIEAVSSLRKSYLSRIPAVSCILKNKNKINFFWILLGYYPAVSVEYRCRIRVRHRHFSFFHVSGLHSSLSMDSLFSFKEGYF